MARTKISRIDQLFEGQSPPPIGLEDAEAEAVGVVQDLLIGHGFTDLPGLLGPARGHFGQKTDEAVRTFQKRQSLPESGAVDRPTLEKLVTVPAASPLACCGYLALVLDLEFTGLTRLVSLTSQFEGAGRFAAINRNTDRAGLSFGLIQWAQNQGRLNEVLRAFGERHPNTFVRIFGDGDAALAQGLIQHTATRPLFGVDSSGHTTNPQFDLIAEPWIGRFIAAARDRDLQRVQVEMALRAFRVSLQRIQSFAPPIRSERGIAFMLDLANQHGDGGARQIFTAAEKPDLSEPELLLAIENESVARVRNNPKFKDKPEIALSTKNRRQAFRTSPLLSDAPFTPA